MLVLFSFFGLMLIGVPIGYVLGIAGMIGMMNALHLEGALHHLHREEGLDPLDARGRPDRGHRRRGYAHPGGLSRV